MAKVYTDKDADLGVLKNRNPAMQGFGSHAHSHVLNLKDRGCNLILSRQSGFGSVCV